MQALIVEFLIRPEHVRPFEAAVTENAQVSRSTEPVSYTHLDVYKRQHMTITEFIDKLTPARRRWADAVVQALCLGMLLVLVRFGWSLVAGNWGNQLTVLEWPMAIQYMGMAVGCSLMALFVAFDLWQTLRGVPREQRYPSTR